ncbi:MAG: nitrilase family protein [Rhodothermales bacterium]
MPPPASLRAATVQFEHAPGDKRYNLGVVARFCAEAEAAGAALVVFPEMCVTGYWHVHTLDRDAIADLAEPVPDGPSTQALLDLARRHRLIVGAGLIERAEDGRMYNAYVVCMPDGQVHTHRKLHTFVSPHLSSGDRYTVFDTPLGVRLGVLICWDNNLVENVRITALKGATVLLAPHQTGGTASRSPHGMRRIDPALWHNRHADPAAIQAALRGPNGREWLMRWLPARAHDNGLFILFSNGVGIDGDEVRTGGAMIIDCYGRIVDETSAAGDAMVVADLDLGLTPLSTGQRWIRGRRPELYADLVTPSGREMDPLEARFSEKPVA